MWLRVALVVAVVAVGYVTMTPLQQVSPQDVCPSRNSCQQRNETDTDEDPCYCDELCNTYADCCHDAEFRNASHQKIDGSNDFRCEAVGDDKVYVRGKCKAGWSDAEVEALCVGGGVMSDPVSRLPVTSNATGYTYPNKYCAICNEDILDLRIWNMEIDCDGIFNISDLVFRNNSWGVLSEDPHSPPGFHNCSLSPKMPEDTRELTRKCSQSIDTCGKDWQDNAVESECQSYTGVVYYNDTRYRNLHCALCNKQKDNYTCLVTVGDVGIRIFSEARPPVSFAVIFDFTDPSRGNLVGSSSPCNVTQVWDPFFKKCKSIVCPKPNQDYRYGKCVASSDVNSTESTEPTVPPTTPAPPTTTAATTNNSDITSNNNSNPPNNSNSTATNTTVSVTTNSSTIVTTTPDTHPSTVPPPTTTTDSLVTFPQSKHPIVFPGETTEPPTTPTDEEIPTTPPPTTPSPSTSTLSTPPSTTSPPSTSAPTTPPPSTPPPVSFTHAPPTPSLLPGTPSTAVPDAALSTNTSSEFAECYKVILVEGEFDALPNGTVYVAAYDRYYNPGEYARTREGVLVCLLDTTSSSRKFSSSLGWVSLAGLGLSCTSLLLHLAAFVLLPELRNLSGRNLASLCLALLAAYITFIVNMLVRPDPTGCVTLAAAMYYFFVTSFTWMNVIAFDVWYTFHLTQRQLRVSNGAQWHRFIAYSLYGWLMPAAATMALVLVDQLEPSGVPEEFLPRLGRHWCWFSHRRALLAFFAAPMVTIIVVNCAFFVSTAAIITQTGSTAAAASAQGNHPRGQYKMYLRLAVLMGFTWMSGIAAGYLDLEALWYVFVLLNTLQGVFIFLAFTFRTRVWQGVGATCRKLVQRGLSKVTRRPQQLEIRAFELSHTPEATSASYSTPNTSLEPC